MVCFTPSATSVIFSPTFSEIGLLFRSYYFLNLPLIMNEPIILGIESSCDDTSAAIINGNKILSNIAANQIKRYTKNMVA